MLGDFSFCHYFAKSLSYPCLNGIEPNSIRLNESKPNSLTLINTIFMIYIFNILLIIITIVCIYAIGYIGLDWFVPLGSAYNPERINTVLINLSYSYIAGLIFYILTTSLPRYVFSHKIRKPLQSKVKTMLGKIEDSANVHFLC